MNTIKQIRKLNKDKKAGHIICDVYLYLILHVYLP